MTEQTDTQTAEIAALTALLKEDWSALTHAGADVDGFHLVATIDGEDRRWLRTITVITRAPSGQHYSWEYEHGLTENQEDQGPGEYYDLAVKPVWPVDKTEVVREWATEKPALLPLADFAPAPVEELAWVGHVQSLVDRHALALPDRDALAGGLAVLRRCVESAIQEGPTNV